MLQRLQDTILLWCLTNSHILLIATVAFFAAEIIPLRSAEAEESQTDIWKRHSIDHSLTGADGVKLADVNSDTYLDVVTGWEESGETRVYLHPGTGASLIQSDDWRTLRVGQTPSAEDAVLVDLDGDERLDVVTCCEGQERTIYVHWGEPIEPHAQNAATWRQAEFPATRKTTRWMYAMPADVDQANGLDLFVGSKDPEGQIGWLRAPASPRQLEAWRYEQLSTAGWIMSIVPVDMDDDGDTDVVYSDRTGATSGIYWLENTGEPTGWPKHTIGLAGVQEVMFIDVKRAAEGNRWSVFAAVKPNVSVMFVPDGEPRNVWQEKCRVAYPLDRFGRAKAIAVGDVDQDGEDEWVVTCEGAEAQKSGVLIIDTPQSSQPRFIDIAGPAGVKFDRIELWDIDGDSDLDILTCEERDGLGVIWYENRVQ
jgi:hypothetical protein